MAPLCAWRRSAPWKHNKCFAHCTHTRGRFGLAVLPLKQQNRAILLMCWSQLVAFQHVRWKVASTRHVSSQALGRKPSLGNKLMLFNRHSFLLEWWVPSLLREVNLYSEGIALSFACLAFKVATRAFCFALGYTVLPAYGVSL
eukprot:6405410-Amphidinium_carterae.1